MGKKFRLAAEGKASLGTAVFSNRTGQNGVACKCVYLPETFEGRDCEMPALLCPKFICRKIAIGVDVIKVKSRRQVSAS